MDRLKTALEVTGGFEGAGWGGVARNFDGAGLSFGTLQWNYGQGTLQALLKMYLDRHGLIPAAAFPEDINATAHMASVDAVKFSGRMQTATRVKPEWREAWKKFGEDPKVVEIQKEMAKPYFTKAEAMMKLWRLDSTKAFCFFFDVAVQNGSMKDVKRSTPLDEEICKILEAAKSNEKVWDEIPTSLETRVLLKAGWDRSLKANPQWQMDVFYRKGAIAMGKGFVHRKLYHFDFT